MNTTIPVKLATNEGMN